MTEFLEVIDETEPQKPIELEIVIIGKGLNNYYKKQVDLAKLDSLTIDRQKYDLNQDAFLLPGRNIFQRAGFRIKKFFRRALEKYIILFRQGVSEPIFFEGPKKPKPTEKSRVSLTPKLLKVARNSTVLKKGITELFRPTLSGKWILFILLIIGVAALAVLIVTGNLEIPGVIG